MKMHAVTVENSNHRFSPICSPLFSTSESFLFSFEGSSYRESTIFLLGKITSMRCSIQFPHLRGKGSRNDVIVKDPRIAFVSKT